MSKSGSPQLFFVLAALTLAAGTGATIFQYNDLNDKWDQLAELKKDARDTADIQKELDDTNSKVVASRAEIEHLEKGVPEFAYVPTMLKELEEFGKQNGIEVLGIRPIPKAEAKEKTGSKRKKEAYTEIAIEVKGRGTFKSVQAFVAALQKFPKILGARAVSLQPKEMPGVEGLKKLDATFELRAYLFTPKEGERMANPFVPAQSGSEPAAGAANGSEKPNGTPAAKAATQPPTAGAEVSAAKRTNTAVKLNRNSGNAARKPSRSKQVRRNRR